MKRLLLLLIVLFTISKANAQFAFGGAQKPTVTGRISAIILDSATKIPVDYATVSLIRVKDNKSVNGGLTDAKGKVVLQNVAPDSYKLVIGFMGYKGKTVLLKTTPEKPDLNAGSIFIESTQNSLKEVTIEGKPPMIENKIDKIVYNAEQDVTTAGGNAGDVMRKVPMVSVDMDGNPSLRGSTAIRVLINGKPSGTMSNSVADALKMIPAEEIKSVEVITSPSAKYDAEGAGGIINIITKRKTAQGVSGNATVSGGTRQNNGNFGLNVKQGRLAVNANLSGQYAIPQDTRVVFLNKDFDDQSSLLQDGITKAKRYSYNGGFGLDYDINAYNNITTNVRYSTFTGSSDGLLNLTSTALGIESKSLRTSQSDNNFQNLDWSADYRKTTKKEGEEFSVSGQASFGRNTAEFASGGISATGIPVTINGDNTGKNNEYTLQSDYIYPFSKTVKLETGVKGIFRNIKSKYASSDQDFDYTQDVGAAYGVINFKLAPTIDFKGGLRAEYTNIDAVSGASLDFKNNYFNLFPSAILSKTLKDKSTLKLSYNKRMQRPSLFYLNPFLNRTDPENQTQGNPDLKPEISDILEIGYNKMFKGGMINASVFYRQTQNVIENIYLVDQKLSTFDNIGKNKAFGSTVFAMYNPLTMWSLTGSVSVNTYNVMNTQTNVSTGTYVNFTSLLRSAITFKGGWSTELFGVYNGAKKSYQAVNGAMAFYGGGFKKDIMKKKATIGVNVLNVFARDLHIRNENSSASFVKTTNIYYPLRSFGASFSYKFGKVNYSATPKRKKISNDDLKQEEAGMQPK